MSPPLNVSFEFFPPADEAGERALAVAVSRLAPLGPQFVSVTHGADGSHRARTLDWARRLHREWGLPVAPHLAAAGSSRTEVRALAARYWQEGFRRLVALRGDVPTGPEKATVGGKGVVEGYGFASELVADLAPRYRFEIFVAAYPEGHPDGGGVEADVRNLQRKIDAGASAAITQFFFDTDVFLRYRDRCRAAGIEVPIVPGILPIRRFEQVLRFAGRCGASIPAWLHRRFEGLEADGEAARRVAMQVAVAQVRRLRAQGVEQFHFYTLNRADPTHAACEALQLRPPGAQVAPSSQAPPRVGVDLAQHRGAAERPHLAEDPGAPALDVG